MSGLFTSLTLANIRSPRGDEPGKHTVAGKGILITWAGGSGRFFGRGTSDITPQRDMRVKSWKTDYMRHRKSREIPFRSAREVKQV